MAGAVNVVDNETLTSQPYPQTNGERTTTAIAANFPTPCTVCDSGAPTENCNYEEGVCTKLSNEDITYITTNGSVLYGPFSLSSDCTPRYLQTFSSTKFAVVCQESSYLLFDFASSPIPLDEPIIGEGGILVQFNNNDEDFYHIEIVGGYVFSLHNPRYSTPAMVYHPGCVQGSLLLHPLFSLSGFFILSCILDNKERAYFMYHVVNHDTPISLDLCGDPLSSLNHGDTFAVTCDDTVTVYMTENVSNYRSFTFETNITFRSYLDSTTLLLVTGNKHHLLEVDTFMSSSGLDGIHTADAINCTFPLKLIAPDLYAMTCNNGTEYGIHLIALTNGEVLAPVENLTAKPLDVYFHFDVLSPSPSSAISQEATSFPTVTPSRTITTATVESMNTTVPVEEPTPTVNMVDAGPPETSKHTIITAATVVAFVIAFVVIAVAIYIYRRRSHISKSKSIQETQRTPLAVHSTADYSPTNLASVWNHGQ